MAVPNRWPRVVAIVGPPASGKSAVGLELAQRIGADVVNADPPRIACETDLGWPGSDADGPAIRSTGWE